MKIKYVIVAFAISAIAFGGTGKSVGTAGGIQTLIPTGARGVALNGAFLANVAGVDAIFYNPAGLSRMTSAVEGQFSSLNWIAGIQMSHTAFGATVGNTTYGISLKSFDFGDIPETTAAAPDGTGNNFSPSFVTVTGTVSRAFSDRIRFGVNAKVISETIMNTSATGLAIDVGVQYAHPTLPFGIGVALHNLGTKMQYNGSDLEQVKVPEGTGEGSIGEPMRFISQAFELPSNIDIAVTYGVITGLNLYGSFSNQAFGFNEMRFGGEYTIDLGGFSAWAGGSINTLSIDEDQPEGMDDVFANNFGPSYGAGIATLLGDISLSIDYAVRGGNAFSDTGVLSFVLGF